MADAAATIQLLVAPVVMVSACGLLCLALYNRLAVIVGRIRALNKEEFDALGRDGAGDSGRWGRRIASVERQVDHLLHRARMVRGALMCLLTVVASMIGCSLAIGLSMLAAWTPAVALGLFLAGTVVMLGGVILAMLELRVALVAAALEDVEIDPEAAGG